MTTKPHLSPRRETILKTILDGYIDTAVPVPSEVVTHKHGLGVSAATVRHEMAALEETGIIGYGPTTPRPVQRPSLDEQVRQGRMQRYETDFEEQVRKAFRG